MRKNHRASLAAVAYFGKGASALLPLKPRSRLVVDASDIAVKSGHTHPGDLQILQARGVRIFSVRNLHSKLFVFGNWAYIGSANVSHHSADVLLEAVVATTDVELVKSAREYIRQLCLHELGEEELARLNKMYRPSSFERAKKRTLEISGSRYRVDMPPLKIAQLKFVDPPIGSEKSEAAGELAAKNKREHTRAHVVETMWWSGICPFKTGDRVLQVTDQGDGRILVSAPGNIIHTRHWRRAAKSITFLYIETPVRRKKDVHRLAKQIGRGARRRLGWQGRVRDSLFLERLLAAWA